MFKKSFKVVLGTIRAQNLERRLSDRWSLVTHIFSCYLEHPAKTIM